MSHQKIYIYIYIYFEVLGELFTFGKTFWPDILFDLIKLTYLKEKNVKSQSLSGRKTHVMSRDVT